MSNFFDRKCKIGKIIREERKKNGWSQEKLAKILVSIDYNTAEVFDRPATYKDEIEKYRQRVGRWERGDKSSSPNIDDLNSLCSAFRCDVRRLFGEINEKTETIHDICERTNLSEKAITNILEYKDTSKYGDTLKVINFLLESNDFLRMIQSIIVYKNDLSKILDTDDEEIKLFTIRRKFEAIVDDITDIRTIKKQRDEALKNAPRPKKLF